MVGAAIYDMYFGEAFCAVLPEYRALYPAVLDYAYRALKDENGLGIAICDGNTAEIQAAETAGFVRSEQTETILARSLDALPSRSLPEGVSIVELDPAKENDDFQWLLWQGFDHGSDRTAFEAQAETVAPFRPHFDPSLSLAAIDLSGEKLAYCCLWVRCDTDYAYVEPVCTIPSQRGRGLASALLTEAMRRAAALGAKTAYVISDQVFYKKLGFEEVQHFTFYWKPLILCCSF